MSPFFYDLETGRFVIRRCKICPKPHLLSFAKHEHAEKALIFARILAEEPGGVLEVKNLVGDVIVFSSGDGWHAFEERIAAHALRPRNTP